MYYSLEELEVEWGGSRPVVMGQTNSRLQEMLQNYSITVPQLGEPLVKVTTAW